MKEILAYKRICEPFNMIAIKSLRMSLVVACLILGIQAVPRSAHATSNHKYGFDEYVVINDGKSPDGQYSISTHGGGELGYEHFHVFLMDAVNGKKIGPLEEVTNNLDTGADAFYAQWTSDSREVAIRYRVDRRVVFETRYRVEGRRAFLIGGPAKTVGLRFNSGTQPSNNEPNVQPPLEQRTSTAPAEMKFVTAGSEHFDVKGLRVGAGPIEVEQFLHSNNLNLEREPDASNSLIANNGNEEVHYAMFRDYSNGKSGLEKLQLRLSFTPPFPNASGLSQVIYGFTFTTYYGEGVTVNEMLSDLQKRYGGGSRFYRSDMENGSVEWKIYRPNDGDFQFIAFVAPSRQVGTPGELKFEAIDHKLRTASEEQAKAYLDQIHTQRPKDTTKPSY